MTTEYAPEAIQNIYRLITVPSKVLSGIVGDAEHTYGYHRARNVLPSNDYSCVLPVDREGDGWAASALDVKLSPDDMKTVSQRLLTAGQNGDPRVMAMREFFGTVNGVKVIGWDRHRPLDTHDDTPTTSDSSHLWHIHISIYRGWNNKIGRLARIADVINGVAGPVPVPIPPHPQAKLRRLWPAYMGGSDYFGLYTAGVHSHGGFYESERPDVRAIQLRLQDLNFAPVETSWADGKFGPHTRSAVAHWQRAKFLRHTALFGQVWHDDWNRLFTY